jgi:hypothetical protein
MRHDPRAPRAPSLAQLRCSARCRGACRLHHRPQAHRGPSPCPPPHPPLTPLTPQVCSETYGAAPDVKVSGDAYATLAYIPAHLDYMLYEVGGGRWGGRELPQPPARFIRLSALWSPRGPGRPGERGAA